VVGVVPASAIQTRRRLLAALEQACSVRFVAGAESGSGALHAMVVFPEADPEAPLATGRLPRHTMALPEAHAAEEIEVTLADCPALPRAVRGQRLRERHAALSPGEPISARPYGLSEGDPEILARAGGRAVWSSERAPDRSYALLAPAELSEGEALRTRLRPGRFLALLPLLRFLGSLQKGGGWRAPPLRASFIFDDPNLHALTYGFLDFRELAAWTRRRGTHVTFAMVPLDGRFASPRAADLFRREPGLSLMIHGNNHTKRELGRDWGADERLEMLEQALARTESFERRTGVSVSRVMAPPHGHCAEASADSMRVLGYEALCAGDPYPWLLQPPPDRPLAGWGISEIVAGGLPVLPRLPLARDPSELVFRALLGQPLIVYGHHGDVREGLDPLDSHTDAIERLGDDVRWCSLEEIARSNYTTRAISDGLELRPYSRLVDFAVPEGCSALRVSPPQQSLDLLDHSVRWRSVAGGSQDWKPVPAGGTVRVRPGDRLRIALGAPSSRRARHPRRLVAAGAMVRRAATELRDRAQPIGRRPASVYR
jgi:hypothetical protein